MLEYTYRDTDGDIFVEEVNNEEEETALRTLADMEGWVLLSIE